MERLTTNKSVDDMSMVELAHNSCYVDDEANARYRDYEMEMDAQDFARNLMTTLTKDELPLDDAELDEEIFDNLTIDPFSDVRGLIALFYLNLCTKADLYEKLKEYEDAEEQGRMIIFPCNKGDKLYEFYRECVEDRLGAGETPEDIINVRKVYGFEYEDDVLYIRASYHSNHSELWGGHGEDTPEFPVSEIGKTVFLTYEEAEAKLKEMEGESDEID